MNKKYFLAIGIVLFLVFCLLTACTVTKTKENKTDETTQENKVSFEEVFTSNSGGNKPLYGTPYGYEMWTASGNNNKLMWYGPNQGGGAAFRAEWNNANIFLGRVGYYWNQGKPYTDYKNIYCDYKFTRSANGTAGGTSYIGIYGWSRNPLVEWYIVEDWFGYGGAIGPSSIGGGASKKGEFTIDGAVYFIYQARRVNEPSIDGRTTFPQFFSVRQTRRQEGTISVTEHFKEWEKVGMKLGTNMYEAKFLIEAGGGTGWIDASYVSFSQKD